ncbi:cell division protein SepF [Romeriopsis navalis]|nr:cell division protein SepF [Romeriopsis navalis]
MGIFGKLRDFVGVNEQVDYEYEYDEMDGQEYQDLYQEDAAPVQEDSSRRRLREQRPLAQEAAATNASSLATSMSNVIGMPGSVNGISEVVVLEPRSFEEMPQVIQALRERKSVVLNLTIMDPDQAQRAVDFVAGGTFAIDGHQERIGESIFLFTPSCVQVSANGSTVREVSTPAARPTRTASSQSWGSDAVNVAAQ